MIFMKLIAQGAEAKLYKTDTHLIKERIKKNYRIEEIDKNIRKYRTRRENSILEKAYNIIPVPKVLKCDEKENIIEMEFIEGERLSESLDSHNNKERKEICKLIGNQVGLLHDKNIIHGDLTTSNMLLKGNKLYFIDFGLSFISHKDEDKAVDLHLLRQALESKHYKHYENSYKEVLEGYKICNNCSDIIKRLESVEKRGRYKGQKKKYIFL